MRRLYLLLAVIGAALPYYFFASFLAANGFNLQLLLGQLFANDISTFFAVDLIITTVVFWLFAYQESRERHLPYWWLFVIASLLIGPSFAFPIFLYVRESYGTRTAHE